MPSILVLPTRVSRLYPIFSAVLVISSSVFLYAWQTTKIELDRLPHVEQQNIQLEKQISDLTSSQKIAETTLQIQKQKISQSSSQLNNLQNQLNSTSAELSAKNTQLTNQQNQLAQNSVELQNLRSRPPLFSFQNQSSILDLSQKEQDLESLVKNAYPYLQNIYGDPYLLSKITITFVNSLSINDSSGEIIINNGPTGVNINIELTDFDKNNFQDNNTVIHELIHGFHGLAIFDNSALEEGMTVAATDAVMQQMIKDNKLPQYSHLYLTTDPATYTLWNNSLKVYADNKAFYNSPDVAKVYQLVGTAWFRLYQADPTIFKKINAAYYPLVQEGLTPDLGLVQNAIRASISQIDREDINSYLSSNQAFNPS